MFEDRTNGYDFNKIDKSARTQVLVENKTKTENLSSAHKKLFLPIEKEEKLAENKPILNTEHNLDVSKLPSSKYLAQFENMPLPEDDDVSSVEIPVNATNENIQPANQNIVDFDSLIDDSTDIKVDNKKLNKELQNAKPKPQKSFSFRIKLVAGVYCILVALFGGWIISNSVEIARTNSSIEESLNKSNELDVNIGKIVLEIQNYDKATSDPNNPDNSIFVNMSPELIELTPEPINEPENYEKESNWFDVFCNWISGIFGGK